MYSTSPTFTTSPILLLSSLFSSEAIFELPVSAVEELSFTTVLFSLDDVVCAESVEEPPLLVAP